MLLTGFFLTRGQLCLVALLPNAAPALPRNALLGASLIKLRKYGHKFLGFTGFRIDFLQSVHQFEVFGTELVEQRLSLSAERFERLGIILLLSRYDLTLELG